mgnify:CR=1 FL=1
MAELKAVFDGLIVKPVEAEDTQYGNIVPDVGKEKSNVAEIVSVGPGKHTITGEFIETTLQVGDRVILPAMGPSKFDFQGEEYYICAENMVLGLIKD